MFGNLAICTKFKRLKSHHHPYVDGKRLVFDPSFKLCTYSLKTFLITANHFETIAPIANEHFFNSNIYLVSWNKKIL